jgi:hypothetical protein
MEEWQKDLRDNLNAYNLHRIASKVTEGGAKQEAKKKRFPCPHCGGTLAHWMVSCCQNCGKEVSWVDEISCKPGQEAQARKLAERKRQRRLDSLRWEEEREKEEKTQQIKQGLRLQLIALVLGGIEVSISVASGQGIAQIIYSQIQGIPPGEVSLIWVIADFFGYTFFPIGLICFPISLYRWLSLPSENVAAPQSQALPNVNRSSQIAANATFSETKAPLKKDKPIPVRQHQAKCPQCMTLIGLNDSHFGKVVACPNCKKAIKFVRKT